MLTQETASQYAIGRTLGLPGGVSVLVTRAPAGDGPLTCGDDLLVPQPPPACSQSARGQSGPSRPSGPVRPGQWFTDPFSGLEVVCTRAGHGVLSFAGRPLQPRA